MFDDILKFIGDLIIKSGGAAAAVYVVYKYIIKNSIDEFFTKRLEDYRHTLNKDVEAFKHDQIIKIEKVKNEMSYISGRLLKYKDREFDVIEDVWRKLLDAIGRFFVVTVPLKEYPDINKMSELRLKEFLAGTKFTDSQKAELLKADNKMNYYIENIFWVQLSEAQENIGNYHNALLYKKIYIDKELYDLLDQYDQSLRSAFLDCRIGKESDDHVMIHGAYKKVKDLGESVLPQIENKMRDILLLKKDAI